MQNSPNAMPGQPVKIAVLGSMNVDLTLYVSHHPAPGETMTSDRYVVRTGGKGANQAVACAKLSRNSASAGQANGMPEDAPWADVRMVGAVGGDGHGQLMRETLEGYGVDVNGILIKEQEKTGIAMITVDASSHGENRIILSPEANHAFTASEVLSNVFNPLPSVIVLQLEIPLDIVIEAMRVAHEKDVAVVFNPAPAQSLPEEVYRLVDHLIVNETEATFLSGVDVTKSASAVMRAADTFISRGVRNVVITLGSRGAYCRGRDKWDAEVSSWVHGRQLPAGEVIDTTGAGDTFVGAYAVGLRASNFVDVINNADNACWAASESVRKEGAMDGVPYRDEWVTLLYNRGQQANVARESGP